MASIDLNANANTQALHINNGVGGDQTAPPARSDFCNHSTHVALSEHSFTVSAPARYVSDEIFKRLFA